ncbi:unnamed protein product [Cyprideis torosa]|uniref:Uncharacterized protein n=1 Tax=Cyprideis torosa TaxID=163714 RepID=A0A7R8W8L8_9CRUS|nr:unnamed protein product [Cyprideis torosa]CAG0887615.1 unnamed protein product [Cyprideis torosa]
MDSLTSFFLVLWTVVGISSGSSSSVLPDEIELPVNVGEVFIQPLDKIFKINATNRKGGEFEWKDGPLLQAIKEGAWLLLEELNLASQSVLEGLNACFDHRIVEKSSWRNSARLSQFPSEERASCPGGRMSNVAEHAVGGTTDLVSKIAEGEVQNGFWEPDQRHVLGVESKQNPFWSSPLAITHWEPDQRHVLGVECPDVAEHAVGGTIDLVSKIAEGEVQNGFWEPDQRSSFSYRASLLNYPDLPPWVHYYASPLHETGFIYGAAIEPGITKIHIISTYVQNRETEEKTVIIKAAYKNGAPSKRRRHVEFFLTNLDLGDLFVTRRMESLMQVAKQIWPESSPDLTLTWLLGGKKSTKRPGDKQGVFVRLGSAAPFSPKLIRFQKESEPLYLRRPCPEDFKKTSGERYFRAHDFVVDWCSFRLVPIGRDGAGGLLEDIGLPSGGPGVTVTRKWSAPLNQFVRRQDLPQRTYVVDAMISLFLPAVISVAMVCLFTLLFCTLGGPTDTDCYSVEDLFPLYEQGDYADTAVKKAETSQKEEKAPSDTPAPLPSAKNGTASLAKSSFFGFGRQKKSEGNREAQKAPPNGATDSKMAGPDPSRGPIIQSFAAQHLANAPGCAADQSPNYSPSEDSSVATSSFRREPTGNNMFANHFHQPSSSFTPHAKDYYVAVPNGLSAGGDDPLPTSPPPPSYHSHLDPARYLPPDDPAALKEPVPAAEPSPSSSPPKNQFLLFHKKRYVEDAD